MLFEIGFEALNFFFPFKFFFVPLKIQYIQFDSIQHTLYHHLEKRRED